MKAEDIVLMDADEIEQFFVETTGMKPGYLQLSAGSGGLRSRVVELAGVTLVWSTAKGRARWRDEMTGDGLHVGFAVESSGPISSHGRAIEADEAQVWMPGREMDLVMAGANLTLDVGVEAQVNRLTEPACIRRSPSPGALRWRGLFRSSAAAGRYGSPECGW